MQKFPLTLLLCVLLKYSFCQAAVNDTLINSRANNFTNIDSAKRTTITQISIYPNPATNKVTLQVKGFEPGMLKVRIMDTKGKLVRDDNRLLTIGDEDVAMFLMLPQGIYFIMVNQPGKAARKKLVIE